MIDMILKMLLGKYFESGDNNFVTMNMKAGIEIRNIIIKNDEINNFLKSKNIDIEIVYLKIERINISFITLSGVLTLKLHGVDLRLKPYIHKNASKGIKNKLINLLRKNQEGEEVLLCTPRVENFNHSKFKTKKQTMCCCCESYKDEENSLSCYNNFSKIKSYICEECCILKNKDKEKSWKFIKNQFNLKIKYWNHQNDTRSYVAPKTKPVPITTAAAAFSSSSNTTTTTTNIGNKLITINCGKLHLRSAEKLRCNDDKEELLHTSVIRRKCMRNVLNEKEKNTFNNKVVEKQNSRKISPHLANLSSINKTSVPFEKCAKFVPRGVENFRNDNSVVMTNNEYIDFGMLNGAKNKQTAFDRYKWDYNCSNDRHSPNNTNMKMQLNMPMSNGGEHLNAKKKDSNKCFVHGNSDDLWNINMELKKKKSVNNFHMFDDKIGDNIYYHESGKLSHHIPVGSLENIPHGSYQNVGKINTHHHFSHECSNLLYTYNGIHNNNCIKVKIDHLFHENL
ncbi:hypothetical protein, conserved [Plasmodium gonderi]|uniref:Uncharacterized protein n=1 Tax=Plasmodium gonderi TaxID=77519 RepID=A0A1Y1JB85_PLAGO|nr:hypothetical protein, conserved [Plasmodium gonderi]GAW79801.1 hypothetical protein, conserved [Plasmodium gonderi]